VSQTFFSGLFKLLIDRNAQVVTIDQSLSNGHWERQECLARLLDPISHQGSSSSMWSVSCRYNLEEAHCRQDRASMTKIAEPRDERQMIASILRERLSSFTN
jgi:hypothetical protein